MVAIARGPQAHLNSSALYAFVMIAELKGTVAIDGNELTKLPMAKV
jgi:hypothetical protein